MYIVYTNTVYIVYSLCKRKAKKKRIPETDAKRLFIILNLLGTFDSLCRHRSHFIA